MPEPDELYTLRNLFWMGNYQLAINEASTLNRLPSKFAPERDEYLYRSYTALGQYGIVLSEIKDIASTSIALRAIRLLATFISNPAARDTAIFQVKEWLGDGAVRNVPTVRLVAATMYLMVDNTSESMKLLGLFLEHLALQVQIFLRIDRLDLAQKQLKAMKQMDEDSTLTMIATAWVNLAMGGTKDQEAAYIYEELIDKHGSSALLLNGLAVAKMHLGQFEDAEARLQEALIKSPSDPDSLANLIVASQHLSRAPEVVNRLISQLRLKDPTHPLITTLANFESAYDRVASTLKA